MSTAVQLGFPYAVARAMKDKPTAYAKPQYVEYHSPQNGNNILYGRSDFSSFHDRARADMALQMENKKRDEEARMKRFLMGNPIPKLPMNSWSSAGRPSVSADKTVPMGDYSSALRGGIQPNYTPEALDIQRKMLKRRANEVGVISRNELPPPTLKPKKTFSESLADVINTVLLSLEDAVGSGNYSAINAGDIYKLFRSLSENGYVFEAPQLEKFKANIDTMRSSLEGVASGRVRTDNAKGAKLLLNAFDRVSSVLDSLLKKSGLGLEQRKIASRYLVSRIKKEDAPPYGVSAYDDMMEQVYAEMEEDRGTTIPRKFEDIGDLPLDAFGEADESTYDPYAEEARTTSSINRFIREQGDLPFPFPSSPAVSVFPEVMPRLPVPRTAPTMVEVPPSQIGLPSLPALVPQTQEPQELMYKGRMIPSRNELPSDLAGLQAFARSIGYFFDPDTRKANLKRGVVAKIRKDIPDY